jgi:hypothetical protein
MGNLGQEPWRAGRRHVDRSSTRSAQSARRA